MATKTITKSSQEQAVAAWINYLRVLRMETLLDKLSAQDCNLEKALKALNEVKVFISNPEHILGSFATKHGEAAEHMQVGFSNAEAAVQGQAQIYTFDGVGRLAMEDYLRDGQMIQSKFYNGVKGTFQAVCTHFEHYPSFINDGGTYDIPRDQYEKLIDIYNRGETARSSLMRSEETLFKAMKAWEADNSVEIKEVIKPAVVGYDEVQLGVADKTITTEETQIKKTDKEIRQDAIDASKPTLVEGAKATALAAVLEGTVTLTIKIYQKKKAGIKLQNFTQEDWKEVGIDGLIGTGKGAIRGAIIYTMTNYTSIPSPLSNAMVTATFGVTAQARKLSKGDITQEDFIDNCEVVCLDVAVSALSSILGEVLIPIPVLGAIIGNVAGMFMYEISKNYLTSTEQKIIAKYKQECDAFIESLDVKYKEAIVKLNTELKQFNSLLALVFDGEMNERFKASIEVALATGADPKKVLKNQAERDAFFSEEE